MTSEPGVSRSEVARRKLVRKIKHGIAVEVQMRIVREEEAELAAELMEALRQEARGPGRPTAVLALDDQQEISVDELERVRQTWRLHMTGHKPAEIARLLGISPRQVRNVLGENPT